MHRSKKGKKHFDQGHCICQWSNGDVVVGFYNGDLGYNPVSKSAEFADLETSMRHVRGLIPLDEDLPEHLEKARSIPAKGRIKFESHIENVIDGYYDDNNPGVFTNEDGSKSIVRTGYGGGSGRIFSTLRFDL